jgi:hypothetical protein
VSVRCGPDTPPPYPEIRVEPPGREWPRWVALLGAALLTSAMIAAAVTRSQPTTRAPVTAPGVVSTVTVVSVAPTSTSGDDHDKQR